MDFKCPRCIVCGKQAIVKVTAEQYLKWRMGKLIQDAFPDKSPDEREVMISGTHPACFEMLYGGQE